MVTMKREKKALIAMLVIVIMFASSFAFIIIGYSGLGTNQQQEQSNLSLIPPDFIFKGYADYNLKHQLLQRGATFLEWHHPSGCCPDLDLFVKSLPEELEFQALVQDIVENDSRTWIFAESILGTLSYNVTNKNQIILPLCKVLVKPPIECAFVNQTY